MKSIYIISLLISTVLFGQNKHPNDIRKIIYDTILSDIQSINSTYINKQIYVDATVPKFDDVEMSPFGVILKSPEYKVDNEFCKILQNTSCVDKIEIDHFKHEKVFQIHDDKAYIDFYGIYAPLDHWFQLIQHTFETMLMENKPENTKVLIPVKHVYFDNNFQIEEHFLYKINLDKDFKINSFQRIKF